MHSFLYTALLLPLFLSLTALPAFSQVPTFQDVTSAAGIDTSMGRRKKYGGPTIADLDNDGHLDLIFCHHDKHWIEVYFNNGDGTFTKSPFKRWYDSHGIVVTPKSPWSRNRRFTVSIGGNYGKSPTPPVMFEVDHATRKITEITTAVGFVGVGGRGRSAVFLNLAGKSKHPQFPDAIFTSAEVLYGKQTRNLGFENVRGKYKLRFIKGFGNAEDSYAITTDINNDHVMELVAYHYLRIFRLVAPFAFADISASVFPSNLIRNGVTSIAEVDYDNDGDFDLYIARTNKAELKWLKGGPYYDTLLENRGGKYYDVSEKAKIPRGTATTGVTTGDFNNDGYIDIFISQHLLPDIMLLNNGDGTFRRIDNRINRPYNVRGDMTAAVDYDSDGLVDLIASQGDYHDEALGGTYRIFRNTLNRSVKTRYIHIRVANAPDRSATSLHAVVTVTAGSLSMTRRVGSPGSAISKSYMEVLHFGLGPRTFVNSVVVRWSNGVVQKKSNLQHGKKILFGVL